MKKNFLIFSLFLLFLTAANAQEKPVTFTFKAGLSISNIYSSRAGNAAADDISSGPYQSTAGFFVAGSADIPLGTALSLVPGLSVTGKGAEGPFDAAKHLYYAEVPVNLVYHIYSGNDQLFIGGGLYAGYLLSGLESVFKANGNLNASSYPAGYTDLGQFNDYYRRFDYGANLVGGYTFSKHISVNAGYGFGLGNVLSKAFSNNGDLKLKNRVFTVGLGYTF